ncbi:MAG: DUF4325 domain-containing protein [Candidatus Peregrinibacteria bacterium]
MHTKATILALALKNDEVRSGEIAEKLGVSRQYAHRMLGELVRDGQLLMLGTARSSAYIHPQSAGRVVWKFHRRVRNDHVSEHTILEEVERSTQFTASLSDNLRSIFDYAFSEMLNNAIEHSGSDMIQIAVEKTASDLLFRIHDVGIGVFRNIQQQRHLKTDLEAIQDLLKGKTTTLPQAHSGEGIFFTSKVADVFSLESFGRKLTIDNVQQDLFIDAVKPSKRGTRVFFRIALRSQKHLTDIFRGYQTDPEEMAFDKTEIQIKLYTLGTVHVSRSQARRVLEGLEKFKSIIFDFDQVPTIGQAFADEIFRVFKNKHPDIIIIPKNMNETVRFWVERVAKE